MSNFGKILLWFTLLMVLAAAPAWGKKGKVYPAPVEAAPQWVLVPQAGGVQYAPNVRADLFCYGGTYYYLTNNLWFTAAAVSGPWQQVQAPPPVFYQVAPAYYKTPPGWAKGKKTGWKGAPMPPGQMKKYYQ